MPIHAVEYLQLAGAEYLFSRVRGLRRRENNSFEWISETGSLLSVYNELQWYKTYTTEINRIQSKTKALSLDPLNAQPPPQIEIK